MFVSLREEQMHIFVILILSFLSGLASTLGPVKAESQSGTEIQVVDDFDGKDKQKPAKDLSGIACIDRPGGRKQCLVINDENKAGQLATIASGKIFVGKIVPLIDMPPQDGVRGAPPKSHNCTGGTKEFGDLDGEGVAVSGGAFLAVGSHGCSRKHAEFRPSSFLLVRVSLDDEGQTREIEWSYRLSDFLRAAPKVGEFFAQPLDEKHHGLNIEGIAALGDELLVGLRAPNINGKAFVVAVPIQALFAKTPDPEAKPRVITLALGRETGIRDLARLQGQGLIILAGPTRDQAHVPFSIHLADPAQDFETSQLATLEDVMIGGERAKAEAVTVIEAKPDKLRLLVLFDGAPNGMPREYDVSPRKAKPRQNDSSRSP
jgi:hypothetical protein